jgi:hypothetical protein
MRGAGQEIGGRDEPRPRASRQECRSHRTPDCRRKGATFVPKGSDPFATVVGRGAGQPPRPYMRAARDEEGVGCG